METNKPKTLAIRGLLYLKIIVYVKNNPLLHFTLTLTEADILNTILHQKQNAKSNRLRNARVEMVKEVTKKKKKT